MGGHDRWPPGSTLNKPHTVKLKLVKKPLTRRSRPTTTSFSVQVDGKPVKNTTFEAYYDAQHGEANYQTDTLLFRLSGTAHDAAPSGTGLLIDDVTIATS